MRQGFESSRQEPRPPQSCIEKAVRPDGVKTVTLTTKTGTEFTIMLRGGKPEITWTNSPSGIPPFSKLDGDDQELVHDALRDW